MNVVTQLSRDCEPTSLPQLPSPHPVIPPPPPSLGGVQEEFRAAVVSAPATESLFIFIIAFCLWLIKVSPEGPEGSDGFYQDQEATDRSQAEEEV